MFDYNSIYHLHVPRTGGIFIKNHLKNQFKDKKIYASHRQPIIDKELSQAYFVSGHFGTYPIKFMNNPIIFSIIRHPVDRYISYYKYVRHMFPDYNKNDLLDFWLNDEKTIDLHSNTQLKNFTGSIDANKYNNTFVTQETSESNWFIEKYSNRIEDGIDFINNNLVFIFDNMEQTTQSLCSLLNISPFPNLYKYNSSDKSDWGITKQQYAKIEELNSLDMELYEYARNKEKEYSVFHS